MSDTYKVSSTKTVFGQSLNVGKKIKTGLMIVCVNRGGGWEPKQALLPHQLYSEQVDKWLKEDPRIIEVACFPVDPDSYVIIWEQP